MAVFVVRRVQPAFLSLSTKEIPPVREHDDSGRRDQRRGRRNFDDDEPTFPEASRHATPAALTRTTPTCPRPATAGRRWDRRPARPGAAPRLAASPSTAAVDTELGVLKTGKEADVHLVRRGVPGTDRVSLLAAKRYRDDDHRLFHRDAGYLEGRRVRRSREIRAMDQPHRVRQGD